MSGTEAKDSVDWMRMQPVPCPVCGDEQSCPRICGRDDRCGMPGEFIIARCSFCQHLFMNPAPIDDDLQKCYPDDYAPHQPVVPGTDAGSGVSSEAWREVAAVPWYLRYLPLRSIPGLRRLYGWLTDDWTQPVPSAPAISGSLPRALEIGCSTGRYLRKLEESGWQVSGVELCERPAELAVAAGLDVRCGTLEQAGFTAESFDLVAAWMVLEHVPRPLETLREVQRVLRPGGQVLLGVPNAGCWQRVVFGSNWYCLDLPRHLQHFRGDSLRRLAAASGLEVVSIRHHRLLSAVVGSAGIAVRRVCGESRLTRWLQLYPEQPRLWFQLLTAPAAILLSLLGQGEGLTVCFRKPVTDAGTAADGIQKSG